MTSLGVGAAALPGTVSGAAASGTDPVFEDGKAQPVFDGDDVVREDYWVEAPLDVDGDGERDRVHVEVARPAATDNGDVRLPVIMEASPYFGGLNGADFHDIDIPLYEPEKPGRDRGGPGDERDGPERDRGERMEAFTGDAGPAIGPSNYEQYFLPRGFAFAYAESLGTGESTGVPTIGDDREVLGIKSVVDWLNGRAPAYDQKRGGSEIAADWTTGSTGMIGVSYNGTLPNGVAATGVDGLEAIVPISAISSWYNYYRSDGLVVAPGGYQGEDTDVLFDFVLTREDREEYVDGRVKEQLLEGQDRLTGDYNDFWAARNYVDDAGDVDAAVLVSHGLNDFNVKPRQFAQWYGALRDSDVPHKLWLHRRGHGDWPYSLRRDAWLDTLNRWWTRWLHGVENDVMAGPNVTMERPDGTWKSRPEWPAPGASETELHLTPGGRSRGGLTPSKTRGKPVEESLVDDPSTPASDLVAAASSPNRLVYRTDALSDSVRLSGTPQFDLRLSIDDEAANLTGLLVDYAPDGSATVVTRGWTDPQNRKSRRSTFAIHPDTPYRLEVDLQPTDYVFDAGHRLGAAVLSSDHHYTKRPPESTELTLDVSKSSVRVPLVGGTLSL